MSTEARATQLPGLKVGFVSLRSPLDRKSWSGIYYYIFKALEKSTQSVTWIQIEQTKVRGFAERLVNKVHRVLSTHPDVNQNLLLSWIYGRLYGKAIIESGCDIVVCPAASPEIAYLNSPVPVVYVSDTTFKRMVDYYYPSSELRGFAKWMGNHVEHLALKKADAVVFCSQWAMESARDHYGVPRDKVEVIPFGANLDDIPEQRQRGGGSVDGKLRLLFVGKGWKRKDGETAVQTFLELRKRGIDASLTIVGSVPENQPDVDGLTVFRDIDKRTPEGRDKVKKLYSEADIFLLPTRAECYGIVFCEAAAYGLPVVSRRTGGIPTAVKDGVTGLLLDQDATADKFADAIEGLWNDKEAYAKMRVDARKRFEEDLNWDAWAQRMGIVLRRQMFAGSEAGESGETLDREGS